MTSESGLAGPADRQGRRRCLAQWLCNPHPDQGLVQRNNTNRSPAAVGDDGKFCFHDGLGSGILTRRVLSEW